MVLSNYLVHLSSELLDDVVNLEGLKLLIVCPDDVTEQFHEFFTVAFPDVLEE